MSTDYKTIVVKAKMHTQTYSYPMNWNSQMSGSVVVLLMGQGQQRDMHTGPVNDDSPGCMNCKQGVKMTT